jgi:hypothetical protein
MCRGDNNSNSSNNDNKDDMDDVDLEKDAAAAVAADVQAVTTPTISPEASSDGSKQDDINNHTKTEEDGADTDTASSPVEYFPWWRGGGIKPRNGMDLGVFDASLEDRANCVALWSMTYLNPLLSLGSRKVLEFKDVGVPSDQDRAELAYTSAKEAWEGQTRKADALNELYMKKTYEPAYAKATTDEERAKIDAEKIKHWKEPSISASLVISFGGWKLALSIAAQVIAAVLSFVPVLILNDLVRYFEWTDAGFPPEDYKSSLAPPWVEVAGLGLVPVLVSLLQTRSNAVMAHCGVFVRTAVSTMLYRKALNVSAAGRAKTSTGQVVNMMSNGTSLHHDNILKN